jgi:hypothetical protein
MLLTHGFAKVDLQLMHEVKVLRSGLPTYLWRVHDLGAGYVGVTGWTGGSMVVLDRAKMQIVASIRTPSPDLVIKQAADDELEFFAFNAGVRRLWRRSTMRLGPRRELPIGTGPHRTGDLVLFVEGKRDEKSPDAIRRIAGERVAILDVASGNVIARSPILDHPVSVIGIDRDRRVLVRCKFGLDILSAVDLAPIGRVRQDLNAFGPIIRLPDGLSALGAVREIDPERFVLIRWRPRDS